MRTRLLWFSFIVAFFSCKEQPRQAKNNSPYKNVSDSVGYVGIQTCKQCHQSIYESFIETGMGQSFNVATKQKSAAEFNKHSLVYDSIRDFYYQPSWQGDSLKITEFRISGNDTIHKLTETVNYIIGSGQHTNSHMIMRNGYVYQAPMTFYTQKKTWDLPPGFDKGNNSRFDRLIGLECMSCHNSYPDFVMGSENKFDKIPNGINCERCHGPGALHVKEKMAGTLVDIHKEIDYSIVNPAKLPVDLQFEICQRCHLQGNAVLAPGKSFYDFKPGMKLSEVLNVFMPRYKGAEDEYIMASHVERLKMSQCFIQTMKKVENHTIAVTDKLKPYKDALTCVTCHNPHVSVKFTGKEIFNNVCRNCHNDPQEIKCDRDTKLSYDAIQQGNCVGCHMPKSNTIDIPHVITTDHFIRKPVTNAQKNKIKEFIGLVCINNKNTDKLTRAKAYIQFYEKFEPQQKCLDSAEYYLREKPVENFPTLIYLYFIKKDFNQIVQLTEKIGERAMPIEQKQSWSNEDAWLNFRIGDAYLETGKAEKAKPYLQRATDFAPYYPEFKNKLGISLLQTGNTSEALQVFTALTKENPNYVAAWSNRGYLSLLVNSDVKMAEESYKKALSLNPDFEEALLNKAGLYISLHNYSKAKPVLKDLLKKFPANTQAQKLLQMVNAVN